MDDTTYLTQTWTNSGHLNVGFDLYRQGAIDAAKTRMKLELEPAFSARGVAGFAQ